MRINKYIAESGFCSRRKADRLVQDGRVFINNKEASLGDEVGTHDTVFVDGEKIIPRSHDLFLAFHKPYGVICTADPNANNTVFEYIDSDERLFTIGRLDVESSGLLLLTNNGDIANKISHPNSGHEKEYIVTLNKPITRHFLKQMREGVLLEGEKTLPALVKATGTKKCTVIITQGRNRQIRRMTQALGYEVLSLKRIRISNIKLGDLGPGNARPLTKSERRGLLEG